MHRTQLGGLAAAGAAAAVAVTIALPMASGAQATTGRTIVLQETRPQFFVDDVAPKSGSRLSRGDRIVIDGATFDAARKRLGTVSATCTVLAPGSYGRAPLQCAVTYQLADGQILAMGRTTLGGSDLPIVGGSGAYTGAKGTLTSTVKPAKGFDDADVLTLEG